MKDIASFLACIVILFAWFAGIAIAHGFWITAAALCLPPYGWYLFVERLLQVWGIT